MNRTGNVDNSKIRVLMVSKALVSGAYHKKLEELSGLGVDLHLIVPRMWGTQPLEVEKSGSYAIHPAKIYLNGKPHFHWYASALERILCDEEPDILHIDEEHYSFVTFQAMRLAEHYGVKTLFFTWQNIYKSYPFPFSAIERFNFSRASAALAGSEEAKEVLRKKGFGKPIAVIPQFGVDTGIFQKRPADGLKRELGLEPDSFVVGYMGRLVEEKGLVFLMQAAALLKLNMRLVLIGSGSEKENLVRTAGKLGIGSKMLFVDQVPSTRVPEYLNCLDCLVLTSLTRTNWKEQFGRVLIEAMACEVPVIGSSSGEIPSVIGKAGLIVPEGDPVALADKLKLLALNKELRAELGAQGRERVAARFTQKIIAEQTVAVYRDMLSAKD